jgi:hypothetical protein
VIGEEGTKFIRPARQCQENVGNEAGFFLDLGEALLYVLWQVFEYRNGETTYRLTGHRNSFGYGSIVVI